MEQRGVSFGSIPVDEITIGERLRRTDPARVEALAGTIKSQGLLQPIEVVLEDDGSFSLVVGAHRLDAVKKLEWDAVPARIIEANTIKPEERRLHEILENLIRHELTKLDRSRALFELMQVYAELYPATRRGGDRKSQAVLKARENQTAIFAIRSEVAEQVGLSDRSIRLYCEIWSGLSADSRDRLPGTALADHQATLKALSELTAAEQKTVLNILLADEPKAATVADALQIIRGERQESEKDKSFRRALSGIERLTPSERRGIFKHYETEIRTYAKVQGWV